VAAALNLETRSGSFPRINRTIVQPSDQPRWRGADPQSRSVEVWARVPNPSGIASA